MVAVSSAKLARNKLFYVYDIGAVPGEVLAQQCDRLVKLHSSKRKRKRSLLGDASSLGLVL